MSTYLVASLLAPLNHAPMLGQESYPCNALEQVEQACFALARSGYRSCKDVWTQ